MEGQAYHLQELVMLKFPHAVRDGIVNPELTEASNLGVFSM